MRKVILLALAGFAWRLYVKRNPQAASGLVGGALSAILGKR